MRSIKPMLWLGLASFVGCVDGWGDFDSGRSECTDPSCQWQTELGSVEEVSTWRKEAKAKRLVGTPARITRNLDLPAFPDCIEIDVTAKVAKDAELELQFDFGSDGSIDVRVPMEPGDWSQRFYYVRTPSSRRHLRVSLAKQGPGEAAFEHIVLQRGDKECAALPATTLANGSTCLDDVSCTSGYCVLGECSPCGAGGCAEGAACRANENCMGGACAAGVCRSCAATHSCGAGEGCSADDQCAAGICVFGGRPSLVRYPELDGVCGECKTDADCPSGKCANGQCAECATDADCAGGLRCRYTAPFEAGARSCVPRFDNILPRGALCEVESECATGLRCGGAPGRVKRCGFSCRTSSDCAADETCGDEGSVPGSEASNYELLPIYSRESGARVRTCYPTIRAESLGPRTRCQVHAQCPLTGYASYTDALTMCCGGSCLTSAPDRVTGACANGGDYLFAQFYY